MTTSCLHLQLKILKKERPRYGPKDGAQSLIVAPWLQPRGQGGWQSTQNGWSGRHAKADPLAAPLGGDLAIPSPSPSQPSSLLKQTMSRGRARNGVGVGVGVGGRGWESGGPPNRAALLPYSRHTSQSFYGTAFVHCAPATSLHRSPREARRLARSGTRHARGRRVTGCPR